MWEGQKNLRKIFLLDLTLLSKGQISVYRVGRIVFSQYLNFNGQLITYFGNFVYGFFVTLVAWFFVRCFPFARQDRQDEMKKKQTIT